MSQRLDNLTEAQARRIAHYLRRELEQQGIRLYTAGRWGCVDLNSQDTEIALRDNLLRLVPGRWCDPQLEYQEELEMILSKADPEYINQRHENLMKTRTGRE